MIEGEIQNSIRIKLSEMGFATFRTNVGKIKFKDDKGQTRWFDTGLPKGHSDLYAVKDGRIYYLEVKRPGGKPSEEQLKFLKTMKERYGCVGGVVYSVEEAVALVAGGT